MPDAVRLRELFDRAVDLPEAEQRALLDATCGDGELRSAVERLLNAHRDLGRLFETDPDESPEPDLGGAGKIPASVGPYRILDEIGRGGMGAVYRAMRDDDEYTKVVAIKLLQRGLESRDMVRRFRRERQILAKMEHPFVARLLDGGTTSDGLPYLVMEYVDGERVDRYADRHSLSIEQRLELFRGICSAVHFAHQHLVIHRDLKPSNILVTADGAPKLLDFGIARLLDRDPGSETGATTVDGGRAMTPEYASPEQVRGLPVSTASDVYSLGVLLFELLTGRQPYRFRSHEPFELARAICDEETPRPSTVIEAGGADTANAPPPATLARLRRQLQGDLDHIVLKAMRKEAELRYASVEQLSDDIARHLEGRPVRARKGTWRYRSAKYVRRHRFAVAATVLVAASLVGFSVFALRERDRAWRETDKATAINAFLQDMMTSANPLQGVRHDVTVQEVLGEAVRKLEASFRSRPETRAALLNTIGLTYLRLGHHADAERLLREALTLRRQLLGDRHSDVAETMGHLADALVELDRDAEAESLARQQIELRRAALGEAHPLTAQAYRTLANIYYWRSDYERAEPAYRQALESRRSAPDSDPLDIAEALNDLAIIRRRRGDQGGAERLYREALALHERHHNLDRPDAATTLTNLAILLHAQRRLTEAEPLARRALEIRQRTLGPDHHMVANSLQTLGLVIERKGELEAAVALYRQTVTIQRRVYREHEWLAHGLRVLGTALSRQAQHEEAERVLRESLAMRRKVIGDSNSEVADGLHQLGAALRRQGRYDESATLLRSALAMRRQVLDASHPDIADNLAGLALAVDGLHKTREANALFEESLGMLTRADPYARMPEFRTSYGKSLLAQRRFADAERQLRSAVEQLQRAQPPDQPLLQQAKQALADVYIAWGKPDRAVPYQTPATMPASR